MKDNENKGYRSLKQLRIGKALRLVWQSSPAWTMASLSLIILQGTLPLLALYLMKLVIDAVTAGIASRSEEAHV